jgi:hypothetical protein
MLLLQQDHGYGEHCVVFISVKVQQGETFGAVVLLAQNLVEKRSYASVIEIPRYRHNIKCNLDIIL